MAHDLPDQALKRSDACLALAATEDLPFMGRFYTGNEARQEPGTCSWPGNIRELENALERAVIVSSGDRIRPQDLPPLARSPSPTSGPSSADEVLPLVEAEKKMIQRALDRTRWNRSAAARLLGVDRTTLTRKIRDYSLQRENPRA